jgi:hypothetical protein
MRCLIVVLLAVAAVRGETVAELMASVRAARERADAEVAAIVRQARLSERLDDAVVEQLQSEGAGPRTVEELEWRREESRGLPAPNDPALAAPAAAPASEDLTRLVQQARATALRYSATLPDFLCTETVRRYQLPKGKPWKLRDTLTIDVAYSEKGERYKPLTIDGKPTKKPISGLGGFISHGEFGSFLRFVYTLESAAEFRWERWGSLGGRWVAVLAYRIDRKNSHYTVAAEQTFRKSSILTGAVGLVYIDPETHQTVRFTSGDDGMPPGFPIRETGSTTDYSYVEVAGGKYLLPRRIDTRVLFREERIRNVTEFGNYRKFSADATVTFEKQ